MARFFRTQWEATLPNPITIAAGGELNLLTLVPNNTKVANGCDIDYNALNIVSNSIKVPFQGVMAHTIRAGFYIQTGVTQYFDIELRRTSDNTAIGTAQATRNNDTSRHTALFESYTNSDTDPFVTTGFYVAIKNQSGSSITLPGNSKINIYIITFTR